MRKFALASAAALALLAPFAALPSAGAATAQGAAAAVTCPDTFPIHDATFNAGEGNIHDGSGLIAYLEVNATNFCQVADPRHSGWNELVQYGTNLCLSANTNTDQVYFATCGQVPAQDWWFKLSGSVYYVEQLNIRAWLSAGQGPTDGSTVFALPWNPTVDDEAWFKCNCNP